MCKKGKKPQTIYGLLNTEIKPKFLCLLYTKERKNFFTVKELLKEKGLWRVEQKKKKRKRGLLIALATVIKKNLTTSIRKHANVLKVQEKTVRTAIKQDLSSDCNPLDHSIGGI